MCTLFLLILWLSASMTTSRPIKPRKVGCCSLPGAVCEDPRLVGGDGITFYLHGSKDQDFCLVSNANLLRINAHFMGTRNPNLTRDFTGFKEMVVAYPHHGFDNWMLVSYFYEGMSPPMKQLLETISWEEPIVKEPPRDRIGNNTKASRVYTFPKSLDAQAKITTIIRRLDDLEAKKVQKSMEHDVHSCLSLPAVQDMFSKQANAIRTYKQLMNSSSYSNTYNLGWKNNSNMSWEGNNNDQFQHQGN
ncbi:hypothetical protein AAG906_017824 [Vitis piasezkii]